MDSFYDSLSNEELEEVCEAWKEAWDYEENKTHKHNNKTEKEF